MEKKAEKKGKKETEAEQDFRITAIALFTLACNHQKEVNSFERALFEHISTKLKTDEQRDRLQDWLWQWIMDGVSITEFQTELKKLDNGIVGG